jgi:hypothetical protein
MLKNTSLFMKSFLFIANILFVNTCFAQVESGNLHLTSQTHLGFLQPKDLCLNVNHSTEGYRVRDEISRRKIDCGPISLGKIQISNEDFCKKKFTFESASYFSCMADRVRSRESSSQASIAMDSLIKKCKRLGVNEKSTDFQLCLSEGLK